MIHDVTLELMELIQVFDICKTNPNPLYRQRFLYLRNKYSKKDMEELSVSYAIKIYGFNDQEELENNVIDATSRFLKI